ncbi:MAG: S-layer homology domain-containing protein [Oscillospiraceae bacterium]|nr:S-layer homology domain-containing protein [Oscillospiraceae bacterium]
MFAYQLSKLLNADISGYDESVFDDVPIDEWYGQSIAWMVDIGLIDGNNERFEPRQNISNEEVARVIFNVLLMRNDQSTGSNRLILLHRSFN